jgi:Protein of unknown function (DUF1501)
MIRENGKETTPFFAYPLCTPPHGEVDSPDSGPAWVIDKDKPRPENAPRCAAMVGMDGVVDRDGGGVISLRKELGIEQDTLVQFRGDLGGFSNIWIGGRITTGRFSGATDKRSDDSIERVCGAGDFPATVYHHLGIDFANSLTKDFSGRPTPIVDQGKPVSERIGSSADRDDFIVPVLMPSAAEFHRVRSRVMELSQIALPIGQVAGTIHGSPAR